MRFELFIRLPRRVLPATAVLLLSACMTVPVIVHNRPLPCPMVTRELTLTVLEMRDAYRCRLTDECLAVLALGTAVFVASTVVSGSLVIIGNTLHWMETYGRCTTQTFTPPEATAAQL